MLIDYPRFQAVAFGRNHCRTPLSFYLRYQLFAVVSLVGKNDGIPASTKKLIRLTHIGTFSSGKKESEKISETIYKSVYLRRMPATADPQCLVAKGLPGTKTMLMSMNVTTINHGNFRICVLGKELKHGSEISAFLPASKP